MQRNLCQAFVWLTPVVTAVFLWPAPNARAQDPFAEAAVAGEERPAPEGEEETVDDVDPDDPIVRSIRESNPTTPDELLSAVETLLRIGARTEAKKYVKQLIDSLYKLSKNTKTKHQAVNIAAVLMGVALIGTVAFGIMVMVVLAPTVLP